MAVQLDFFREETEYTILREEFRQLQESMGNVRKGLFARHTDLAKKYMDLLMDYDKLKERLEWIEKNTRI